MPMRTAALLFATVTLAACEPGTVPSSNPPPLASQPIYQPPVQHVSSAQRSIAQQTAGNPNYDRNGNYIGPDSVATVVEIPVDDNDLPVLTVPNVPNVPAVTVPQVETPDTSAMNCTGATTGNAGTLDCTN